MADWRLAVDIGGTFTDTVLLDADSGRVVVGKELTTPANPLEAVQTAIASVLGRAGVAAGAVTAPIVHATTLVTNALVQRRAGRAALVVTQGFADTLLIRDEHRYDMYDLQIEFPDPPIPRQRILELDERVNARGEVLTVPVTDEFGSHRRRTGHRGCGGGRGLLRELLHERCQRTGHRGAPGGGAGCPRLPVGRGGPADPGVPAHDDDGLQRGRHARAGHVSDDLESWLAAEGFGGSVLMMLSNGGVVPATEAARVPIRLVESGPAAGALGRHVVLAAAR